MSTVGLNMIVKDEEKHLAECLESVKDVVDEIVVVDTGSKDNTVKIAEKYGAKIFRFEWCNDFSKARNFALSKSNSDWVLYLDADERLDKSSIDLLRQTVKSGNKIGLRCKILNIDEINHKPKLQRYTRLFKNSADIKFRGRAHEQIDGSLLENNYKIFDSDILINHIGYNISREGLKKKAERNLELLLAEYKEKSTGYCAFQIGNSYNILENETEANKYYDLSLKDKKLPKEYRSLALSYCAEHYLTNGNAEEAVKKISEAVKTHPENIISNLVASEIYFKLKEGEKAVAHCKRAFALNEKGRSLKSGHSLIEIYQAPEKIIYHGLNIASRTNSKEGIEYFFINLEKLKKSEGEDWDAESEFIQKLSQSAEFKPEEIKSFVHMLSFYSLAFYQSLLGNYKNAESKPPIMKGIVEKFPDDIQSRNQYGVSLGEANRIDEAVKYFETVLSGSSSNDPTPVFHLISLFIKQKNFRALGELIERSKVQFSGNTKVLGHLAGLESKLSKLNVAAS